MQVTINKEPLQVPEGASLADALKIAGIPLERKGIAVALNGTVQPRSTWPVILLQSLDEILVIHARQGG